MIDADKLDWAKGDGLLPAIIQDAQNAQVLMLGYMNREALKTTLDKKLVTFYSRSKERLWTKGETSGNTLGLVSASMDCDRDTILIKAVPAGPTCHTGTQSCFEENKVEPLYFLQKLSGIIATRRSGSAPDKSYVAKLFADGKARIAQKVGEEGVEVALACMKEDREELANESADLLFHLLVALEENGLTLDDVCAVLKDRHK